MFITVATCPCCKVTTCQCIELISDSGFYRMENVCALNFLQNGSHIITSLDRGVNQVWDVEKVKIIRNLRTDEPTCRIAAIGVHTHLLVGGNRLGTLRFHDLRVQKHEVATIRKAHTQEVRRITFGCFYCYVY